METNDYIDRKALRNKLYDEDAITFAGIAILNNFPAADVAPVIHAKWLYDSGSGRYFCSACQEYALSFKKDTLYGGELYEVCMTEHCPECGAKMDLED